MEQQSGGMAPMSEEEREIFRRVWRRVMPEDRPDCPFLLDEQTEAGAARPAPAGEETAASSSAMVERHPSQHTPAPAGATQPALSPSRAEQVLCMGERAAPQGPGLMRAVEETLSSARRYAALARQMSGTPARTLTALAQETRWGAKRLSTAYFLIAGVNYWPDRPRPGMGRKNVRAELRQAFQAAQRCAAHLEALADETCDPCLADLCLELAGQEHGRALTVRGLLERM